MITTSDGLSFDFMKRVRHIFALALGRDARDSVWGFGSPVGLYLCYIFTMLASLHRVDDFVLVDLVIF